MTFSPISVRKYLRTFITLSLPVVFSISTAAYSNPLELYFQRLHQKLETIKTADKYSVVEKYYQQLVDHTNPESGRFAQRYLIDESYSTSNDSPIFLYLCGEGTCEPSYLDVTIRVLAEKYHAKLIALEHRYYGKSLPRKTFSVADMKYLTHENVLADIVNFQKDLSQDNRWTGKWLIFGGSYSGTLSAFYRVQRPDMVAGSIASSAPVMVKPTFEEFDAHATAVAGPICAENLRKVIREVEAAIPDKRRMTEIKSMFNASKVEDNIDFLALISDIGEMAIQYGYKDFVCNSFTQGNTPLQGYAAFSKYLFLMLGLDPVAITPQGAMSEDPADYEGDLFGFRQWTYQTCTAFGSWITANADPEKSMRSSLVNLEYNQNVCRRLFGIETMPDTDALNDKFYKVLLNESSSKIYFTNGSDDPWSKLSISAENGNATNKNLDYFTVKGGAHCDDLRKVGDESGSLNEARGKMDDLIKGWLAN